MSFATTDMSNAPSDMSFVASDMSFAPFDISFAIPRLLVAAFSQMSVAISRRRPAIDAMSNYDCVN
jgi:hypothetical protein